MKARGKLLAIQSKEWVILKMGVMILATILAVFLFFNTSQAPIVQKPESIAITETPSTIFPLQQIKDQAPAPQVDSTASDIDTTPEIDQLNDEDPPSSGKDDAGDCDLFTGEWIPNPSGPAYTNDTCDIIEAHQNCMTNGRPDSNYLYWRWRPRDCELPLFDAKRFLERMRHKTWALIGDSISRNHVQSLVCTLSQVEKVDFFYHDEDYRSRGWRFPSYNVTIYVLWAPFLVEAAIFEDFNGNSNREIELQLDKLDNKWTQVYKSLDYMIFATGKWFLKAAIYYQNNTTIGCHYCPKRNLTELGFDFAYREALKKTLNFIATSDHKGLIFFRTSTPDHFEGGAWDEGGGCNRTTPYKVGEVEVKDLHNILRRIELEEFGNAELIASQNGVKLKMLDFMQLNLLRPDGHPGPYREYQPFAKDANAKIQNDCLHWCLPGAIDSWNDVIMKMVDLE